MNSSNLLSGCELHLHILGAYYAEDILELGQDHYRDINWDQWGFVDAYEAAFGVRPDPIKLFADAVNDDPAGFERFKRMHVYSEEDGGDFERWEVKGKFGSSVWTHYRGMGEKGDRTLLEMMLNRHRAEGLDYVEYRAGSGMDGFLDKSLESAARWCHEIAEMGAKRIAHTIALGLDPAIAISRRQRAHEAELVSERLDQIAYDLQYQKSLATYGVDIDVKSLTAEQVRRSLRGAQ